MPRCRARLALVVVPRPTSPIDSSVPSSNLLPLLLRVSLPRFILFTLPVLISVQLFLGMEQRRGQQQCSSKGAGNRHAPPPLPPPRRAREEHRRQTSSGSFSASLLDAIYRSLDEGGEEDAAPRRRSEEKATAPPQFWWAASEPGVKPRPAAGAERRPRREGAVARPRHSGYASSTTSSSDSSSASSCSTGFSCSSASTTDTESTICRRRHNPPPPRVPEDSASVAVAADAAQPKGKRKSKSRPCFPGARFRPKIPSQPTHKPQQPPSPATFACALKALFTSAGRLHRKPKSTPAVVAPQPPPISPPPAQPPRSGMKADVMPEPSSVVVRRRVEELVRGLEELEEDEEGSDSSSDLFELESLRGAGADELPVYGTTSIAANRAIAQRAAC